LTERYSLFASSEELLFWVGRLAPFSPEEVAPLGNDVNRFDAFRSVLSEGVDPLSGRHPSFSRFRDRSCSEADHFSLSSLSFVLASWLFSSLICSQGPFHKTLNPVDSTAHRTTTCLNDPSALSPHLEHSSQSFEEIIVCFPFLCVKLLRVQMDSVFFCFSSESAAAAGFVDRFMMWGLRLSFLSLAVSCDAYLRNLPSSPGSGSAP